MIEALVISESTKATKASLLSESKMMPYLRKDKFHGTVFIIHDGDKIIRVFVRNANVTKHWNIWLLCICIQHLYCVAVMISAESKRSWYSRKAVLWLWNKICLNHIGGEFVRSCWSTGCIPSAETQRFTWRVYRVRCNYVYMKTQYQGQG